MGLSPRYVDRVLELPAGTTTLEAWFANAADEPLCGAFFVTVRGGD